MFAGSNVLHSCSCNQESYHEQRLAMTERCKYERQLNMKDSWRPHLEIPALAACDFRGFSNICSELLNSISTERNNYIQFECIQGHHGATFTDVSSPRKGTRKGPKTKQAMYNLYQTNAVSATVFKNESFVLILSNIKQTVFVNKLIITLFFC